MTEDSFSSFVSQSDGQWFNMNMNVSNEGFLDEMPVSESTLVSILSGSTGFIGEDNPPSYTRFRYETVSEMNELGALLMGTPTLSAGGNFVQRIAIPNQKDQDYNDKIGKWVAVEIDWFTLPGVSKSGDPAVDERTYASEPHVKRNGLTTFGSQPAAGTNPQEDGAGAEFVLQSLYFSGTFNNNDGLGDKGDLYGLLTRPEGSTSFDSSGLYETFSVSDPVWRDNRQIFAVGVYGKFVTDYNYQSQIYPCYSGTNLRLTFPPNTLHRMKYLIKLNTTSSVGTGSVSNNDGMFRWWIESDAFNGGQPFLAAYLDDIDVTGTSSMKWGNIALGQYNGGSGITQYLDEGRLANGIWYNRYKVSYKEEA